MVIIGTMIGAGFASGQEIKLFFSNYGMIGILGLIISCILTGIIIYKVFKIIQNEQVENYAQFLNTISTHTKINNILKIVIQAFLLISFYIMIAGFSAFFKQEFKIPTIISSIIIALLCYITFKNETKAVVSINTVLIPFLSLFIIMLGIKNINFTTSYFFNKENFYANFSNFNWLISSILYASYNSIILIPILLELKPYIVNNKYNTPNNSKMIERKKFNKEKSYSKIIATICTIILIILGFSLFTLLLRGSGYIQNLEMPIIQVVKEFGKIYSVAYGVIIIMAIFTTAVSAGYGFLKSTSQKQKIYKKLNIFLCISSVFVAPLGFSNLVSLLYPIFGILGLIQIIYIFIKKPIEKSLKN